MATSKQTNGPTPSKNDFLGIVVKNLHQDVTKSDSPTFKNDIIPFEYSNAQNYTYSGIGVFEIGGKLTNLADSPCAVEKLSC
jgi:hypothetical protein